MGRHLKHREESLNQCSPMRCPARRCGAPLTNSGETALHGEQAARCMAMAAVAPAASHPIRRHHPGRDGTDRGARLGQALQNRRRRVAGYGTGGSW